MKETRIRPAQQAPAAQAVSPAALLAGGAAKVSKGQQVRVLMLQNPGANNAQLAALCAQQGIAVTANTLNMCIYEMRQSLLALQAAGFTLLPPAQQ